MGDQSVRGDLIRGYQSVFHRGGSLFGELLIEDVAADVVGMPVDVQGPIRVPLQNAGDFARDGLGLRTNRRPGEVKVDAVDLYRLLLCQLLLDLACSLVCGAT